MSEIIFTPADVVNCLVAAGYDYVLDVEPFMKRAAAWRPLWEEFQKHAHRKLSYRARVSAIGIFDDIREGRQLFRMAKYTVNNNDAPKMGVMFNAKFRRKAFEQRRKNQKQRMAA